MACSILKIKGFDMTPIKEIIQDIKTLEPISEVTHHLLDVLDDKTSNAEDIAKIIQYEPTVTTNVIRTCNSAYYGREGSINSINDAITILGTDKVVDIVFYQSGRKALSQGQNGYKDEHEGVLWKLSVSSAIMAKQIALRTGSHRTNLIFTAALIKDIGKTVLGRFVKGSVEKINKLVDSQNLSFADAERKVIGIDHAELGGLIAKSWNFPHKIEQIIRHHHTTDSSVIADNDIATVYLADKICMLMGLGGWVDRNDSKFYNAAMESMGIRQTDLPELIADFSYEMQEVEDLLRVV